jgi:hypothetical protein
MRSLHDYDRNPLMGTGEGSGLPAKCAFRLARINAVAAVRDSGARPATCGVTTTLSHGSNSGSRGGTLGSPSRTSKPAPGALRNPAADFSQTENTQALARNGRGLDTPLILPSRMVKKFIYDYIIVETKRLCRSVKWQKAHLIFPFFRLAGSPNQDEAGDHWPDRVSLLYHQQT